MGVLVKGCRYFCVAETLCDQLDFRALADEVACVAMPQIVNADPLCAG